MNSKSLFFITFLGFSTLNSQYTIASTSLNQSAQLNADSKAATTLEISVSNSTKNERHDEPVVIDLKEYSMIQSALVTDADGKEIPCQLDDLDGDDQIDELCFLVDLKPKGNVSFNVKLFREGEPRKYAPRVYAEMLMRNDKVKQKNQHNNFIESITARGDCANSYNLQHHHGVSFESELNGIRIYFDKRQTLDLYGKFKKRLELQDTQFYTQADQKEKGYGDDVLWVGNTFGLGAFRGWNGSESTMIDPVKTRTQRVVSYGPLRTIVEIIDRGWKASADKAPINMTIRYTQYGGHRDTDVDVFFNKDVSDYTFSTGIINIENSEEYSDHNGLRACWGTDWPSTDTLKWKRETLGLAICIPQKNITKEVAAVKGSRGGDYTFVVKSSADRISYKVAYSSANEEFGFHSAADWFRWVRDWKRDICNPIKVKCKIKK